MDIQAYVHYFCPVIRYPTTWHSITMTDMLWK